MIKVTRFNNSVLLINAENIQSVEANPDTVITFINRDRLLVKEPVEEVTHRIVRVPPRPSGPGGVRRAGICGGLAAGGLKDLAEYCGCQSLDR